MKKITEQKNKGFTLIETMVAVFILTVAIAGLLGLTSRSLFSARYANNEITANYLIQEVVDSVRNDRDTVAFQQANTGGGWDNFVKKYDACFVPSGCYVEPADTTGVPAICAVSDSSFGTTACPVLNYDETGANNNFYTYKTGAGFVKSKFKRQVLMSLNETNRDELDIKVLVEWQNGNLVRSESTYYSVLNWQK